MQTIGTYMALAGVISTVLHFLGMNLKILIWINMWGPTMGWVIRLGLIALGVLLMIVFSGGQETEKGESA